MPLPTIDPGADIVTTIHILKVKPENQAKLVKMLCEFTQGTMQHLSGFISATFHASLDGTKVINYAQWRSLDDYGGILKDAQAMKNYEKIKEIAESDPALYQVAASYHD